MMPDRPKGATRVRIVGDHPHRGAAGVVRDDLPMKFGMWRIDLDAGSYTDGCFAGRENLRPLPRDEDREVPDAES